MSDAEYRSLLSKLRRFFEWHRCESPEDLAQDTLLRGLRRLSEGQSNFGQHEHSFYLGIARNIVREQRKRHKPDPPPPDEYPDQRDPLKQLLGRILLRECLNLLSSTDRDLLIGYILDGAEKTAKDTAISPNALRIRVSRIRGRIKEFLRGSAD